MTEVCRRKERPMGDRGEFIDPVFKVPQEAAVTIPYRDFEYMKSEIYRLRKMVIRLSHEEEQEAGKKK